MNIQLIRQIQRKIKEEPRCLNMVAWISQVGKGTETQALAPDCGTIACLAGWAIILSGRLSEVWDLTIIDRDSMYFKLAGDLLGLTPEQSRQVFLLSGWPEAFKQEWSEADGPQDLDCLTKRAEVAYRRLDFLIDFKA